MTEQVTESPRKRIERAFEDTKELFDPVLGFPFLPAVEILPIGDYLARMKVDGVTYNEKSVAYLNHDDGILFANYDAAMATDMSRLVGNIGIYGVLHYAFVNSSEENRRNFSKIESLKGISAYAQYHVKKHLMEKKGYHFDIAEEIEKMRRFVEHYKNTDGWPAKVGMDVVGEKCSDSGQSKMIKPIIRLAVISENPGAAVYEMRGKHYVTILREALMKGLIECEIQVSNDVEVMERVKNVYFLVGDDRDVRVVMPELRRIADLLDSQLVEEKNALIDLFDDPDIRISSMNMKDLPEYEGIIHQILKRATVVHNRPLLINESAENESDRKKFAIIK